MGQDSLVVARARATRFAYSHVAKPIYFRRDPERVHNSLLATGAALGSSRVMKALTSLAFNYQDERLAQWVLGMRFRNPVGLSAGFDKNGTITSIVKDVGFGFTEVGSVTAQPCPGNSGVRLRRLPERRGLWVHLGLNNDGADAIYERLSGKEHQIPIGISVAKTNCPATKDPEIGLRDYLYTIEKFREVADYFDINISCPNAYGAKDFADPDLFERLASSVARLGIKQPIFVKLSPDLDRGDIDEIMDISSRYGISGLICTNLTERHDEGEGGLSGKCVETSANAILSYVRKRSVEMGLGFTLIGVGGVFSAGDAYKKIKAGASLVQLITGMIYEGPGLIGEINYGLTRLLERDGFSSVYEAVGADAK